MMKLLGSLLALVVVLAPVKGFLTPNMQATVLRAHNEARSNVRPTASNMQRMVRDENTVNMYVDRFQTFRESVLNSVPLKGD